MAVDLDKLMLHSSYNSFKNSAVNRGNLALPTSIAAGDTWISTVTFTLAQAAVFMQGYSFATDYGDYFNYLDSQYHNAWRVMNENSDYLVFSSSGLLVYTINMTLSGSSVTFTLRLSRLGFGAVTINHPTYLIPITLIDYRLAN